MPKYTCEKCLRTFARKSGYTDHINKKTDCAQTSAVQAVVEKVAASLAPSPEVADLVLSEDESVRKAELQKFFEDLHHLLWSVSGLSPEKALDHMIFFFAYRLFESQADELKLPNECRWSYLMNNFKNSATDLDQQVRKGNSWFLKDARTKLFFKQHEIKRAEIVQQIMILINRIPMRALTYGDTLGDIFEYMLGRGMSTMSDEGQYFTNRKICSLAFDLAHSIKKTVYRPDGSLSTFADWFAGTGGFPAEFVKGATQAALEEGTPINWKTSSSSIYCQDMSTSSVTTTLLNMLILTGVAFSSKNIRSGDSFRDPITMGDLAPHKGVSIDYCFMNPPYGGDKTKGKDYKFAYSKTVKDAATGKMKIQYQVNSEIQSVGIADNDKVSAGVQLAMATLSSDGGVCCIVLPDGFFSGISKKSVELRKKIAEEYRIHYVVDIVAGSFINTGTKTSMMVFQKGVGITEKAAFIGLDGKLLAEATLEELRVKHYSLNFKRYLPQSAVEVEGFEMVKLASVVSFKTEKSKKDISSYTYIDIGSVDKGVLKAVDPIAAKDLPGRAQYSVIVGDVLVGTVRPNLEHHLFITPELFRSDLIVSNAFSIMRCDPTKILPRYLYSIMTLPSTTTYLTQRATGTTYPVVTDTIIGDMEISLPSLERQKQVVDAIDGWANLAQNEEVSLKMLENRVMFQVKEMGRGQSRVKLGEVCEFQRGKMITKKDLVEGEFPVIGGGLSPMGHHISSNRNEYTPLISQSGENAGHISRYTKPVWASDCFSVSSTKMSDDFLYYSLLQIQDEINFLKTGTAQPHIYPSSIDSLTIVVPPITEQQTLQSDFDEIRHKHQKIARYNAKAQEAIQRLIPGAE